MGLGDDYSHLREPMLWERLRRPLAYVVLVLSAIFVVGTVVFALAAVFGWGNVLIMLGVAAWLGLCVWAMFEIGDC